MEIKPYDGPFKCKMRATYGNFGHIVQISSENYVSTPNYNKKWQEKLLKFKTRPEDVWVVTHPKSGTTWTQEMVWRILNDDGILKKTDQCLMKRFPYFEYDVTCPDGFLKDDKTGSPWKKGAAWEILKSMEDPRTIKSHLHLELLPRDILTSGAKIIYVCRDSRDVCVSYYYHMVNLAGFKGDFQDFFVLFINELHLWSPYWKHVLDYWKRRESPNILFLRYEDLKENLPKAIKIVVDFLGKSLTNDYIEKLTDHLSFSKMSLNASANNEDIPSSAPKKVKFMRKGEVGDWKSHFTSENKEAYKEWTERKLKGTDFPYYRDYD